MAKIEDGRDVSLKKESRKKKKAGDDTTNIPAPASRQPPLKKGETEAVSLSASMEYHQETGLVPAGHAVDPEGSVIAETYRKIDGYLPRAVDVLARVMEGEFDDSRDAAVRMRAAAEILGKRVPTATGVVNLGKSKRLSFRDLAERTDEELERELEELTEEQWRGGMR